MTSRPELRAWLRAEVHCYDPNDPGERPYIERLTEAADYIERLEAVARAAESPTRRVDLAKYLIRLDSAVQALHK